MFNGLPWQGDIGGGVGLVGVGAGGQLPSGSQLHVEGDEGGEGGGGVQLLDGVYHGTHKHFVPAMQNNIY